MPDDRRAKSVGRSAVSDAAGVMLCAQTYTHTRVTLNNNKFHAIFNFSRRKQPDELPRCTFAYSQHEHTFYHNNGAQNLGNGHLSSGRVAAARLSVFCIWYKRKHVCKMRRTSTDKCIKFAGAKIQILKVATHKD